jgi:dCMP deaminase
MSITSWDSKFMNLAAFVAMEFSKDPSTKVGAVICDEDNRVVSIGYNGFPKGIKDDDRLQDREKKYSLIVHAERNAMLFATTSMKNCTLYTYPFLPCSLCAGMVIQCGIKRVVSYKSTNKRWMKDFEISREMFEESGIMLCEYNYD